MSNWRRGLLQVLTALVPALLSSLAAAAEPIVACFGSAASALVPIAQAQGYFAAEGVDVQSRQMSSGKESLEALMAGRCALATGAAGPVASSSLLRKDLRIVAAIAGYNNFEKLIVRSDRGVHTLADLRGRRVAVVEFTSAHHFLDLLLTANAMTGQDVVKVYRSAPEVERAFRSGEVDAAAHWEPHIQTLAAEFGPKAKVFAVPGLYSSPFLLVGAASFVDAHAQDVKRILRALLRAERFVRDSPASARSLVSRTYGIGTADVEAGWSIFDYRVSLDQSLLLILENAARWRVSLGGPGPRQTVPDYLDLIHFDGLSAVKPQAVTIIR